jgi:calcineurin-like phosphoesterase family protein
MNIWFTSDTHFYHTGVLHSDISHPELLKRNFTRYDVEKMNEAIIYNWNRCVEEGE